jgi:preprotein translocase subunit SecE
MAWVGQCRLRAGGSWPNAFVVIASDMAISPFKFLQEVRTEAQKVTWPTRRETAITTAMVFVMVAIASIFFLVADQIMRFVVTLVLGIGG